MCLTRVLLLAALTALLRIPAGCAEGLTADRLGVLYNLDEAGSRELAFMYASRRDVPKGNVFGVHLGVEVAASPDAFSMVRGQVLDELPTTVQSLLLVWTKPFAVGCMSITSAFASGYGTKFCEPKCGLTAANPLFDTDSWLPADTVGWWPAMLLPSADGELARRVIERGIASDGTVPPGIVYLVRTQDTARNVRAADYVSVEATLAGRLGSEPLPTPIVRDLQDAIGYFTGATSVEELARIGFRPGAVADHLTSSGGVLIGGDQMSIVNWLRQGATGSYGSVSEPCNFPQKFPDPGIFFNHYLRGDTLLEAYWKSVAMPGQGLFIGEPLARPYGRRRP